MLRQLTETVTIDRFRKEVSENTEKSVSDLVDYAKEIDGKRQKARGVPLQKGCETELEMAVVYGYTTDDFYSCIKADFRAHVPQKWPITAPTLASCIEHLPSPTREAELYRGELKLGPGKSFDQFEPGNVDVWDSFSSTSLNMEQAYTFSEGNIIFKIKGGLPQDQCGLCNHLSMFSYEEEVLVKAGCQFEVISHEEDAWTTYGTVAHLITLEYKSATPEPNPCAYRV